MEFRILVLSHNVQMFLMLQHALAIEGFSASLVTSSEDVTREMRDENVRAIIIDHSSSEREFGDLVPLKAMPGEIAVVLLCNQTGDSDRPFSDTDVDLVLIRPFDPIHLIEFLRRKRLDSLIEKGGAAAAANVLRFADLEMNTAAARVRRNGSNVPLTALQFRLLRYLLQNPEIVQSRETLIAAAWPTNVDVEPRTVDIHIGLIRRALRTSGPCLIRTVRTRGYALGMHEYAEK
jgi:two-component system phosphate regulon response regulator PhoB